MTARELALASTSSLMAAWIASGGAIETSDEPAFRSVPAGDEGLRAGNLTTNPWTCADDGLQPVGYTGTPRMCADDGLQAGHVTGLTCS